MPKRDLPVLDADLSYHNVQALNRPDAIAAFFARLGYNTNARTAQTPGNLGITTETTVRPIKKIELIADQEGLFQVYLFDLQSVTVVHTRALARAFRNRAGNYLLVLTSDYERLDFVLLEKYLPAEKGNSLGLGQRQVGIRPRVLTVERHNPGRLHLRVLRRLTWTEADPFAQYDKLLSAYALADWSEEYFNNRALFSDYYLKERLQEFQEWREDPKPPYLRLREIYQGAPSRFAGKDGGKTVLCNELLEPTLATLGFQFRSAGRGAGASEPDYRLYAASDGKSPLALCLAYPWDRYLDGKDDQRDKGTPDENPGAVVVTLLEKGEAPWVVVTNGRLWRLYAQRTHARATNYYEIDLEEVLAQAGPHVPDPAEAFRYFWLLFRSQAFVPVETEREGKETRLSLLDRLLLESEDYAKELGERLKGQVFVEVFPHLGEGFIRYLQEREGPRADISLERLDQIFHGTITLLYRILFLLYAEARDLLPAKDVRGYYDASLARLKKEIAEAAGAIGDEVAEKLKKRYREDSYDLYDRISRLFRIVDKGDSAQNVPVYNGGLFLSDPDEQEESTEAEAARFLNRMKAGDRFLARAIDLLARAEDSKRHDLVFIDFKSLGVRHLGSIYEGLLEFKLKIAERKLAVVKEKDREFYTDFSDLDEKARERAERHGRVVKKSQVYLENDKRERKATGSYYTPDHIVKYIVEHTVGPVLQEKFEAMRPKLREAQRKRRAFFEKQAALRKQGLRPEPESKAEYIGQEVVDELFDIKVLDPAMGSGHFLVEAVDFITDKALDFLNAFPWNPVFAHLNRMRETILQEMEDQGITIDSRRLTDVNLLKRHVLKRCIYGVDLNPMAVELAKVSLWLDCFTLGAPLSFLDHHLRCGNSLIGVTVNEVNEAIESGQLSLLSGTRFEGMKQAVAGMIRIGELSDVTAAQVAESRREYLRASEAMKPAKRLLDIYTSQWFGNAPTVSGRRKNKVEYNPALEFLRDVASEKWAQTGGPSFPSKEWKETVAVATKATREKRFFHWELEFPEVFYGPRPGTTQKIERLESVGFDAVIGNPPYFNVKRGMEDEFARFAKVVYRLADGQWDVGELFYERTLSLLLKRTRPVGLIVPKPFFLSENYEKLRLALINEFDTTQYAPCGQCFPDPGVEAAVAVVWLRKPTQTHISLSDGRDGVALLPWKRLPKVLIRALPFTAFSYLVDEEFLSIVFDKQRTGELIKLGKVVSWTRGVEVGKRDSSIVDLPATGTYPVIFGETVEAYSARHAAHIKPGADISKFKEHSLYAKVPKVLLRRVALLPIAALDITGAYTLNTLYVGHQSDRYDPYTLVVLLNSAVLRALYQQMFNSDDSLFPYIRISQIDLLPVPAVALHDSILRELGEKLTHDKNDASKALRKAAESRVADMYGLSRTKGDELVQRYVLTVESGR